MQQARARQPNGTEASFGGQLFALRATRQLSQAELARRALLSRSYLSEVEHDRRPPPSVTVCRRLVAALDLTEAERLRLWASAPPDFALEQPCGVGNIAALIGDLGRLLPRLTPDRIEKVRRHLKEVTA